MKKVLLCTIFLILINLSCFAQVKFEKGYFIDNDGIKTECLIKNYDWRYNPTSFEYKLSKDSEIASLSVRNVKEFGFADYLKYISCEVDMDRSSDIDANLSDVRRPIFNKEVLFLKQIVRGKANLYLYEEEFITRFFYNVNDSQVKQLVYKRYRINSNSISKNIQYLQQLYTKLKYKKYSVARLKKIRYSEISLTKYFMLYNGTTGQSTHVIKDERSTGSYNLSVKFGMNINNLALGDRISVETNASEYLDALNKETLNSNANMVFGCYTGIELEYLLPFYRNKYALFLMPAYRMYTAKSALPKPVQVQYGDHPILLDIEVSDFEMILGARYYMFHNKKSKIYIDAAYDLLAIFKSKKKSSEDLLNASPLHNFYFNLGYTYNNRISAEFRYMISRAYVPVDINLVINSFGLSIAYKFFTSKK